MNGDPHDGRDIYLRYNGGPVQHFRVWDGDRFLARQVERGREQREPADRYEVSVATAAEYRAEHKR